MSGIEYVADTNAIIYLLLGKECMKPFFQKKLSISLITKMELLSFPRITDDEDAMIREYLKECDILGVNFDICERTILLRRNFKIKLPDAIVAATAMTYNASLITADTGFYKLDGLEIIKLNP
ncbi:MAG: type II toxin-antitoxin system VapC family toxin [Proteobacteria bacterium]|nr:type II toxin-antitoxin system VapC family toxin [Pseudomonadota bacterium]